MQRNLRSLLPATLLLLVPLIAFSGWWRTYGGPSGETGQWLEITDDGSYIMCGGTLRDADARCFLMKTGPTGDSLWFRMYTLVSLSSSQFYAMHKTTDKGYVMTGYAMGLEHFAPDIILMKVNSSGDSLWARSYKRDHSDYGYSIQQTLDGGYVVAGTTAPNDYNNDDVWILRFDSQGDTLWTYTYDGGKDDFGYCVRQTLDGNFVVTGFGETEADDLLYLFKLDDEGNLLWQKTYGNNSIGKSVVETPDGGLLVAGSAWGYGAVYLLRTDENGDSLWSRTYWNTAWCRSYCIEPTSDGGYIIAGVTSYNPFASQSDGWLLKTDSLGDTLWTRQMITTPGGKNNLMCVKQTEDGGYIISGSTGRSDLEKGFEIWLIKTDSLGLLGIEEFDNPPSIDASTVVGRGVTFSYSNLDSGFHAVVYSSSGQKVAEIHSDSSTGTVTWGAGHRPGVYFIRELSGTIPVRKIVLIQ